MPIAKVQLPDGRIGRFEVPDGTTPEQVLEFAQNMPEAPQQASEPGIVDQGLRAAESISRGVVKSATGLAGSVADASASVTNALGLTDQPPGTATTGLRSGVDAALRASPTAFQAGGPAEQSGLERALQAGAEGATDAASIFVPGAALARGLKAGTTGQGVARSLAAQPGVQAGAGSLAGTVQEATDSPGLALAAALAAPTAVGGARRALGGRAARQALISNAPATGELRRAGGAAFEAAKSANVKVSSGATAKLVKDLGATAADEGLAPGLQKATKSALDNIVGTVTGPGGTTGAVDFRQLHIMRRQLSDAAGSLEPGDQRTALILRDKIDDFVNGLKASDLSAGSAGDATRAASQLREGRALWTRLRKTETIEDAINLAQNTASGVENGLRTEFKKISDGIIKGKIKGFTKEEVELINGVHRGTLGRNLLKLAGKFGISLDKGTQALLPSGGLIAGTAAGGPVAGLALLGGGTAARELSKRGTANAAELTRALTASGPDFVPPVRGITPALKSLVGNQGNRDLAAALLAGRTRSLVER